MQLDPLLLTLLGELLLLLRELKDGTSESLSLSLSLSEESESESDSCCLLSCMARRSTSLLRNCSLVMARVSWGLVGRGLLIWEGDRERPFAISAELRWRECFADAGTALLLETGAGSMLRMFSIRPVVASLVDSSFGS